MYTRIIQYIEKNNIFFEKQYGFRKKRSTTLAIIELTEKIKQEIDNNKITIGIFLDLSKAFDTVNHQILLKKLEHYGIRGVVYKWFESYLSGRMQHVKYNDTISDAKLVSCGVPQGSVLGPLLFLIYINDINVSSQLTSFILFADDTNLFYSGENVEQLNKTINAEMQNISQWLIDNQLTLNIKKTNYIVFKSTKKKILNPIKIFFNNCQLTQVKETKFLGVIIDEHLNWNQHINYIANKISKSIGIICKARYFLNSNILRTLYNTLIYPYLYYGNIVWANNYPTRLDKVYKLQKKVIRIITHSSYDANSAPLFKKLKLLNLQQINDLCIGQFIFEFYNNSLPEYFKNFFTLNKNVHNYGTRNSHYIHKERYRTNYGKFTIKIKGSSLWNKIPSDIKEARTKIKFKKDMKDYLLS